MIERIPELVNADANLVRRGRFLNTTFLIEIGEAGYLVRIVEGRVVAVTPGPFITPNYSFALRAPREAWETFWRKVPPPGFNDLFALFKRGTCASKATCIPSWRTCSTSRTCSRRLAGRPDEPAFRADRRPLSQPRTARPSASALSRRGRSGHCAALPAHRGVGRPPVPRPAQRAAHHAELPRHRVRHALARQILAAGRLAGRGIPPHLARLCADDPASRRRPGTRQSRS